MQQAKRVAINTGILYARMGITVFISLYITRLILAALGTEDFGIFNVVAGAVAMLTFLNSAMSAATQRFISYAEGEGNFKKQKFIFNVSVVLHLLIAFVLVVLIEFAGYFLFKEVLKIPPERIHAAKVIFQFMILSTFFTVISVPYDAVIIAHENMLFVAILGITESLLKLLIAFYITYTGSDKLINYGLLMALISIFLLIFRQIYSHSQYKEVQINFKKYFNKALFKEMSFFAGWALLSSAASMITMQGISIVLNSFFGVLVNAAQGVANQIAGQLSAFPNTMLKALNPVIVKNEGRKDRGQMLKTAMTGSKISFFLFAIVSVPVILDMPFILEVWLEKVPDYAVIFCRLILIRLVINQLTVTFPTAISAIGKIRTIAICNSIIWILTLPVSYLLFKGGASPEAIYVVVLFTEVILAISYTLFLRHLGGLSLTSFFKIVVVPSLTTLIVGGLFALIPMFLMKPSFLRLILIVALDLLAFLAAIYYIGLDSIEKQLIKKAITTGWSRIKLIYRYA